MVDSAPWQTQKTTAWARTLAPAARARELGSFLPASGPRRYSNVHRFTPKGARFAAPYDPHLGKRFAPSNRYSRQPPGAAHQPSPRRRQPRPSPRAFHPPHSSSYRSGSGAPSLAKGTPRNRVYRPVMPPIWGMNPHLNSELRLFISAPDRSALQQCAPICHEMGALCSAAW
jgi:hypothetical protein